MTDKNWNAPQRPDRDAAQPTSKPTDEAYAADIPTRDADRDEGVKGGMYKKAPQQMGET